MQSALVSKRMSFVAYFVSFSLLSNPIALANGDLPESMAKPYLEGHHGFNLTPADPFPIYKMYDLQEGESWESLSERTGTPVNNLLRVNDYKTPNVMPERAWAYAPGFGNQIPYEEPSLPTLGISEDSDPKSEGVEQTLAEELVKIGESLNEGGVEPYLDSLEGRARSYANEKLESSVVDAFQGKGTVRFSTDLFNNFEAASASLDALLPLYDRDGRLLFSQFGYRYNNDSTFKGRDFLNVGLGLRYQWGDQLLGVNGFVDHDMDRGHNRGSIGFENWRDNLKLSSNYYFPLSDWKDSSDLDFHVERAAHGLDAEVSAYVPGYPQLGGTLSYAQYFGDKVDVTGSVKPQRNPYEFKAEANYSPVSAVSMRAGLSSVKGERASFDVGLDLNYKLGVPWSKQISPEHVGEFRRLQGQWLDLVERNNNIVLEYKEKQQFTAQVSDLSVSALNSENNFLPLTLSVSLNGHTPLEAWSRLPKDYEVEWSLPEPVIYASNTYNNKQNKELEKDLRDLQSIGVIVPIFEGDFPYTVAITHKPSGQTQRLRANISVKPLAKIATKPNKILDLKRKAVEFELVYKDIDPLLERAIEAYISRIKLYNGFGDNVEKNSSDSYFSVQGKNKYVILKTRLTKLSDLEKLNDNAVYRRLFLNEYSLHMPIILSGNLDKLEPGDIGYTMLDAGMDQSLPYEKNKTYLQAATGGNGGNVVYSSDDTSVATVDDSGKVTLKGIGSATITAKEESQPSYAEQSDSYKLTVGPGSGVKLLPHPDVITQYRENKLVLVQASGGNGTLKYSVDNKTVAEVDKSSGLLTIKGVGSTKVFVEDSDDNFIRQNVFTEVTVSAADGTPVYVPDQHIFLDTPSYEPEVFGGNPKLKVKFSTSDESIVRIRDNKLEAVSEGVATVTATTSATSTQTAALTKFEVTVSKRVGDSIFASDVVKVFGEANFQPKVSGGNGSEPVFISHTPSVVTVVKNQFEIKGIGIANVTVKSPSIGSKASTSFDFKISVVKRNGVALEIKDIQKKIGDPDFSPSIKGGNGSGFEFKSGNDSVIEVVNNKLSVKGVGTAVVTVKSLESPTRNEVTSDFLVKVIPAVYVEDIEVKYGDSSLSPIIIGGNGTTPRFISEDPNVIEVVDNRLNVKNVGVVKVTVVSPANVSQKEKRSSFKVTVKKGLGLGVYSPKQSGRLGEPDVDLSQLVLGGNTLPPKFESLTPNIVNIVNNRARVLKAGKALLKVISPEDKRRKSSSSVFEFEALKGIAKLNAELIGDDPLISGLDHILTLKIEGKPELSNISAALESPNPRLTFVNNKLSLSKIDSGPYYGNIIVTIPETEKYMGVKVKVPYKVYRSLSLSPQTIYYSSDKGMTRQVDGRLDGFIENLNIKVSNPTLLNFDKVSNRYTWNQLGKVKVTVSNKYETVSAMFEYRVLKAGNWIYSGTLKNDYKQWAEGPGGRGYVRPAWEACSNLNALGKSWRVPGLREFLALRSVGNNKEIVSGSYWTDEYKWRDYGPVYIGVKNERGYSTSYIRQTYDHEREPSKWSIGRNLNVICVSND